MNKTELIGAIAQKSGLTRVQASQALNAALEAMTEALCREEKVQLPGFGSFTPKHYPAHQGRNPQTGAPMEIAAHRGIGFRAGSALKAAMEK